MKKANTLQRGRFSIGKTSGAITVLDVYWEDKSPTTNKRFATGRPILFAEVHCSNCGKNSGMVLKDVFTKTKKGCRFCYGKRQLADGERAKKRAFKARISTQKRRAIKRLLELYTIEEAAAVLKLPIEQVRCVQKKIRLRYY